MGLKKNQVSTALGLDPQALLGRLKTTVISYTGNAATIPILSATPAGKVRRLLSGEAYTCVFNRDGITHNGSWAVNSTAIGRSENFGQFDTNHLFHSLVLNEGDTFGFILEEATDTLPVVISVAYTEDDAATATYGGSVTSISVGTQVSVVPAPATGKVRVIQFAEEGNKFGVPLYYNSDPVNNRSVLLRIGSTIVDVRDVSSSQVVTPGHAPVLTAGQSITVQLDDVPQAPVVVTMSWDDYDAAP